MFEARCALALVALAGAGAFVLLCRRDDRCTTIAAMSEPRFAAPRGNESEVLALRSPVPCPVPIPRAEEPRTAEFPPGVEDLPGPPTLQLWIEDSRTGAPLSEADVFLTEKRRGCRFPELEDRLTVHPPVERDGSFLEHRTGTFELHVVLAGYARVQQELVLHSGEELRTLHVRLERGVPLEGRILAPWDFDGEGVSLTLLYPDAVANGLQRPWTKLQSDGRFRFSAVLEDVPLRLRIPIRSGLVHEVTLSPVHQVSQPVVVSLPESLLSSARCP